MTVSLLAAGTLALLALPAFANNKDETADVKFKNMDTDGDGKISRTEFASYDQQRFSKMDANGDGVISLNELSTDGDGDRDASDKFKKLDTDGDGKLSATEQKTGCDAKFTTLDTDGDGYISQSEMMAAHKDHAKKSKKY
jgi:Ca2+-binding EF-hand superfamily protein